MADNWKDKNVERESGTGQREDIDRVLDDFARDIKYVLPPGAYQKYMTARNKAKAQLEERKDSSGPRFNNALQADAHNWDIRELARLDNKELREKIARALMRLDSLTPEFFFDNRERIPQAGETVDEYLEKADPIVALLPDVEQWVDIPEKRGDYWLSAFVEGRYISPRILSVIDYERPGRGLEVQYEFTRESIPVKTFCKEYYPNGKWMLIPEPSWQALKKGEIGATKT